MNSGRMKNATPKNSTRVRGIKMAMMPGQPRIGEVHGDDCPDDHDDGLDNHEHAHPDEHANCVDVGVQPHHQFAGAPLVEVFK